MGGGGGLNELVRSGSQTFIIYLKRHRILIPYKYVFQVCCNSNNSWGLHCWDEFKKFFFSSPLLNFKLFFFSLSLSERWSVWMYGRPWEPPLVATVKRETRAAGTTSCRHPSAGWCHHSWPRQHVPSARFLQTSDANGPPLWGIHWEFSDGLSWPQNLEWIRLLVGGWGQRKMPLTFHFLFVTMSFLSLALSLFHVTLNMVCKKINKKKNIKKNCTFTAPPPTPAFFPFFF